MADIELDSEATLQLLRREATLPRLVSIEDECDPRLQRTTQQASQRGYSSLTAQLA